MQGQREGCKIPNFCFPDNFNDVVLPATHLNEVFCARNMHVPHTDVCARFGVSHQLIHIIPALVIRVSE